MSGALTPEEQLKVLQRIWGLTRAGYVFLPWIEGTATTKAERKKAYHEGRAYKWPRERPAILEHLSSHDTDEMYFSVNLFEGKKRVEQYVAAESVLYADLDAVHPETEMKPTIAWGSSPGHYQGVWLLNSAKVGATWSGNENHRLTVMLGADPSGWDGTQLLRVPGRPNFKPEYRQRDGSPVMGEGLMWMNGPRYVWSDFDDLPQIAAKESADTTLVDEQLINAIDRHEAWARVRLKLSHRVREYMAMKDVPKGMDRSDVLWEINRELADAGCSAAEIVAITRPSVWNKFSGRWNELDTLIKGAVKAVAARSEEGERLEAEEAPKPNISWLSDVAAQNIPRPRWLVKDVWTKGGLGFISGAPKSYKSWMALDMAVSITTGTPFLNQPGFSVVKEQPVLYLQEEDDLRLVMDRLQLIVESKAPDRFWAGQLHATIDDTRDDSLASVSLTWAPSEHPIPLALHVQTGFIASDEGWQAWLDDIIAEGKFSMVIIDTLGTTAGEIDTDKSGELMNRMLRPLRIIARKHDTAICIVHHNKKGANQGQRAGQDMLGSTALHAWVECAIYARSKDANGVISVEREAKLAMDMGFQVRIPMMFQNYRSDGDRQLWDPEVVTAGLEQVDAPLSTTPSGNAPEVEYKGTAGKTVAMKMKHFGRGPHTFDSLHDTIGGSPAKLREQLDAGVENGYLTVTDDERWAVVR